jgi:hypothetical protein
MSLHEKITQIVDEELEERVNAILNEYALTISKKHAIPLELLLKDIPTSFVSTTCKGRMVIGVLLDRCTMATVGITKHKANVYVREPFQVQVYIPTDRSRCLSEGVQGVSHQRSL